MSDDLYDLLWNNCKLKKSPYPVALQPARQQKPRYLIASPITTLPDFIPRWDIKVPWNMRKNDF
jgi:hypothetical protein